MAEWQEEVVPASLDESDNEDAKPCDDGDSITKLELKDSTPFYHLLFTVIIFLVFLVLSMAILFASIPSDFFWVIGLVVGVLVVMAGGVLFLANSKELTIFKKGSALLYSESAPRSWYSLRISLASITEVVPDEKLPLVRIRYEGQRELLWYTGLKLWFCPCYILWDDRKHHVAEILRKTIQEFNDGSYFPATSSEAILLVYT